MYISYKKLRLVLILILILLISIWGLNIAKSYFPIKYSNFVYKYSDYYGLDPNLVFALIKTESSFNSNAVSSKNAIGLMQITDKTGLEAATRLKIVNFKVSDLYDPETNIRIGCWYISWLTDYFDGDADLAIAAYNGGLGNVNIWLKDKNLSSSGEKLDKIPFKETRNFVNRVKSYTKMYRILY